MTIVELLYGIMFEPRPTLQYISEKKPLAWGLTVYLIVLIFNAVFARGINYISPKDAVALLDELLWIYLVTGALFSIVVLFLLTGLFSLLSDLFYGHSNSSGLLACLCFASVPGVLGPPLQYSALLTGASYIGTISSVIISVWVLVLQIMALKEALALRTGQAINLFIMPFILAIIVIGVIIIVIVSTLFPW